MRKFISVLAVLGMLSGISVVLYDGTKVVFRGDPEGHSRLQGDFDKPEIQIKIIAAPLRQIHRHCLEEVGESVPGCARWEPGLCTIWIPEPIGLGDWTAFHIAGHELWHCKIGNYHPPNPK